MPNTNGEGTIISNGKEQLILKGGQWLPYDPNGAGAGQEPFKIGDSDAIGHAWDIISNIDAAKQLSTKPLSTGTLAASITGVPVLGGMVGQNRANLQTKLGSVAGDLRQLGIRTLYQQTGQKGVGSVARNQAEQQALQNSLAAIGFVDTGGHAVAGGAQPDAATLNQGLDQARNIYIRHLARLYNLNPDDPSTVRIISSAATDPKLRDVLMRQATAATTPPSSSGGSSTTPTTPAPPILKDEGTGNASISGSSQTVEDPQMKTVGAHITQMLNSGAPDDAIRTFAQAHAPNANIEEELNFRRKNPGSVGKFVVDPSFYQKTVPLTGVRKAIASVDAIPYVGPAAVGAADTALAGAAPDIAGAIHAVTGAGPTRQDVITARDISAQQNPGSTFVGNMGGVVLSPFGKGGGVGRTALTSGAYGFFGSEDPSLSSRLTNAGIAATLGAAAHGAANYLSGAGYRGVQAARAATGPEAATNVALERAASQMPRQDIGKVAADLAARRAAGVESPAAVAVSRPAQDFLARIASGSPGARAAADDAAVAINKAMPEQIAGDFNKAIEDAAGDAPHTAEFLNRPVRDVANDVQNMAGREFEAGIQPIKSSKLAITDELAGTLEHERVAGAIRDALANHSLDDTTRNELRTLLPQLKTLAGAPTIARQAYAKGIPLTVDGARNIATALDRTAGKLADGSEAQVEMSRLSRDLRGAIAEQYPEYAPVNARYASRMRAKEAMFDARRYFLGDSPEQIDALAKSSNQFTGGFNEPEYGKLSGVEPVGEVQPSNRQFAMAGAREAAATQAGAGAGTGGASLLRKIAAGPSQQERNAMVLNEAAPTVASRAGMRADTADVINRIASSTTQDQSAKLYSTIKRALMYKLTGGTAHYAAAYALAGIPGVGGEDAAKVVQTYLNSGSNDQVLKSLTRAYGAQKARTIMSRMVGVASGAYTQHQAPILSPAGAQ